MEQRLRVEAPGEAVSSQEPLHSDDALLEAQSVDNCESWTLQGDPGVAGPPQFCEVYLHYLDQVLIVNIREKSPCAPSKERGKGTAWKCPRVLFSILNKACPQAKRVNRSLPDLGKGNAQLWPSVAPCPAGGREKH